VVPLTAIRTFPPPVQIFSRLPGSHEFLHAAKNRFGFCQIQTERLHGQLMPCNLDDLAPIFGAILAEADHFHAEFHTRGCLARLGARLRSLK
jgi:hypothetical protein